MDYEGTLLQSRSTVSKVEALEVLTEGQRTGQDNALTVQEFKPPWVEESRQGKINLAWKWPRRRLVNDHVDGTQVGWKIEVKIWFRTAQCDGYWKTIYSGQELSLSVDEEPDEPG
eukprot:CAMPEP_0206371174 /NCGR_PEP_ID=MMETSP0294-20121207/6323_1 /ASSEMBLY_ACC=CAM_ASM_000327 /TAXON_ID=39354 /ORGANISM="Heterosigma akashiwo, Strain CCMP2393" /LENGTH=114 /DNA_ID=CAMNT_0053818245 /DNA_START=156 /DNA_END=496 /DNA_ORIENTATION=+